MPIHKSADYTRYQPAEPLTTKFSFAVERSFHDALKEYARRDKRSLSELCRSVLIAWVRYRQQTEEKL